MRILFVSSSSGSRGGGEIFLLYLGQALREAGHSVALWTSSHPRMDELAVRFAALGEVQRDRYRNTYDHWHRGVLPSLAAGKAARQLATSWRAWRPDIIHLNKQNLEDGNDLLAAASIAGIPHLCTIHITQSARFLGARFAAWRDARAKSSLQAYRGPLVTVSPIRGTELAGFIGQKSTIRTIMNGVPPPPPSHLTRAHIRTSEGMAPAALGVVAVGRLEPQKNPLRFLRYAEAIRDAVPDAQLRWIGAGRMTAEWNRDLASRGLQGTVRRIDWRDDVRGMLPAFDLFLHTATFEGLPLAVLEAMDAALPCLVEKSVHAQLPASLRACALAVDDQTNWRVLLAERGTWAERSQRGHAMVRAEFSTAAMAQAYVGLYREICAR